VAAPGQKLRSRRGVAFARLPHAGPDDFLEVAFTLTTSPPSGFRHAIAERYRSACLMIGVICR